MTTKLVLGGLLLVVAGCINRYDCKEPFVYSLYGNRINLPMSVDEAVKAYKLIPNAYRDMYSAETRIKSAVMIHYKRGYDDDRYKPRTSVATQKYYNYDYYAVRFRIFDSTATRTQILAKLKKDFGRNFQQKETKYDFWVKYYETRVDDCVALLVYNDVDEMGQKNPNITSVAFCYKLNDKEITAFMETLGWVYLGD